MEPSEGESSAEFAFAVTAELSEEIGPRAPSSPAEEAAANRIAERYRRLGLVVHRQEFPAYRSFGRFHGVVFALAFFGGLLPRSWRAGRAGLSLVALGLGYREGEFAEWGPLKRIWRGRSQNVYSVIEPKGGSPAKRTVCLVSHMDSSRSGWMFHPGMRPYLGKLIGVVGLGVAMRAADALAELIPPRTVLQRGLRRLGRRLGFVGQLLTGFALVLIGQRELRGEDVPGANDNASGVGVCLALACELAAEPLAETRVVVLVTGCEEAGLLGMRHFLSQVDTEGWMFLNFDGMGASAPLRYLEVEGGPLAARAADAELIALAETVGASGGELSITAHRHGSGLAYDSTAVLARGGRALTLAAQAETIPNYHWPSDRIETIDRGSLARSIGFAQEMLAGIDRGAADRRDAA